MASWEQLNFQNRFSPLIEQFIFLHDHIISILVLIMVLVSYVLIIFSLTKNTRKKNKRKSRTRNLMNLFTRYYSNFNCNTFLTSTLSFRRKRKKSSYFKNYGSSMVLIIRIFRFWCFRFWFVYKDRNNNWNFSSFRNR